MPWRKGEAKREGGREGERVVNDVKERKERAKKENEDKGFLPFLSLDFFLRFFPL
jgi:hypothetical protein